MSNKYFKTTKGLESLDVLHDCVKEKCGAKYKVQLERASKGVMKYFSGQQTDIICIRKNAYHGIILATSGKLDGVDYQTISVTRYTPNSIVDHYIGRTGILDKLVARVIWGKGDTFYNDIEDFVKTEYEASEVDNSLWNNAKQMFKGKSVFDE